MCENAFNTTERAELQILWEIRSCELTMGELMTAIGTYQAQHPDQEIFMDGDLYAIVARKRPEAAA